MPRREVLLDAGPLVALLSPRDPWHARSADAWPRLTDYCVTTEAVLAEACHLMLRGKQAAALPLEVVLHAGIPVVTLDDAGRRYAARLMRDYANLPMDYADACLVAVGETLGIERVFTIDRRGFGTYRMTSGKQFEIVP